MRISQSRIKLWRKCRRAYHYRYVDALKKKVPPRPLRFGSLVHRMAEFHLNGRSWKHAIKELTPKDHAMFESEREAYGNIIQDASDIMQSYVDYWAKDGVRYLKLNGQRAEHTLELKLTPSITGIVIIDFLAATENGRYWLGDHKTFNRELSDTELWRNIQSTVYHRAYAELGRHTKLHGTMWDMIYSKAPTVPKLTKLGELSKAAIVTLPPTVLRFFSDNRMNPYDHKDLLDIAFSCRERYFKRTYVQRMPLVEATLLGDFIETAKEIDKRHGRNKARNVDRHCDWCEFNMLCQARFLGLDFEFIKRNHYTLDESRLEEVECGISKPK